MLRELHFSQDAHSADASASDFAVTIVRKPGKDCGYPQCEWMWHMKFTRGGCMASAFLDSLSAAQSNAARIVGHMRGTHDLFGNELGSDGKRIERSGQSAPRPRRQDNLFAMPMEGK